MGSLTYLNAERATAAREQLVHLLRRVANGDKAALGQLYLLTSPKLNALLLRMLRDEADAEEALQDVYLTVWRRGATFDAARASPITWLVTIARNKAIDRLRARRARGYPFEVLDEALTPDGSPSVVDRWEEALERERLMACLEALEARQQAAIRAAFFEGLTYEALAARADVPLGTMKSWIRRGLLRLRACLDR